jgi:hypothetical protein
MESPAQLQLAPWDQATNHQSAVKARIATAQQAGLLRNLRRRDLPAHRGLCRPLARPATATCNFVQDNPHQRAARHDSTRPGSLDRPADRSRELGVSGILTT